MPTLNKLWAGRVYGTNTGNLFIDLKDAGPSILGTMRFRDDALGVVVYEISGAYEEILRFTGKPTIAPQGIQTGTLTAEARLTPEGQLRGRWTSSIGTGGTFEAHPHDANSPQTPSIATSPNPNIPEQIFSRNTPLRSLRLFNEDIRQLIRHSKEDFVAGRAVVTYNLRGSQVSRYDDQFLSDMPNLDRLDYLKINIQEQEAHGINRVVTVELSSFGTNEVRVQGIRESWVTGKSETILGFLRTHDRALVTTYRKFGLNINGAIFVGMLIVMPSISSWQNRLFFALGVFLLLFVLLTVHARLIPNTTIILGNERPTMWSRSWPTLLSWIVTVTTTVAGGLLLYWLTREPPTGP